MPAAACYVCMLLHAMSAGRTTLRVLAAPRCARAARTTLHVLAAPCCTCWPRHAAPAGWPMHRDSDALPARQASQGSNAERTHEMYACAEERLQTAVDTDTIYTHALGGAGMSFHS